MQCDVCDVEQMSEEEILACLVSDTELTFTVRLFLLATLIENSLHPQAHDCHSWRRGRNVELVEAT